MRMPKLSGFVTTSMTTAIIMAMTVPAYAKTFIANDIIFDGIERVTIDSLQQSIPIRVGQTVTDETLADSIRALYATEHFADVQADVNGDRVVFHVTERPVIAELNFVGNKLIPKAGLEEGLKNTGLSVGNVLKQSTVTIIENELKNQYILQGYYNIDIQVKQTKLDGNRVKLDIEFIEGKAARVVDINIIGNQYFSDDDIKDKLAIKDRVLNPLSKANRYSQEKLNASLESLRALYLNEGFVRFAVDSSNLSIDEEKNKVFVEIALTEGQRYSFGKIQFMGDITYGIDELNELVTFKEGDGYSQSKLEAVTASISEKFGDDGYYYAQIRPVTRIDDETRTVNIDYYIDPVRPVYVRRINFGGNVKTKDEVLRREMRQLEGALASNKKIYLSRIRLMRTGFFKDVRVQVVPVPNSPDQVDVNYTVEEQPSGSSTIAAGYSRSGGLTFQFELSQSNFMGTGNRVNASFSRSETRDVYSLGLVDPYFTQNGVSQSFNAYYRKTKYDAKNINGYILNAYGAALRYGYPIDENQRLSAGINVDNTEVQGGAGMAVSNVRQLLKDGGKVNFYKNNTVFSHNYVTYGATLGWSYSSIDKPVFPTKGMSHDVDLTLGFGKRGYQKAVYTGNIYVPFWKKSIIRGYTRLGYGNNLPFYENFYAGGYGSVRGYNPSTLGPRSQSYALAKDNKRSGLGENVGGNVLTTFGAELILPMPFKGDWSDQIRPVVFFEGGQVFDTTGADKESVDLNALTGTQGAPTKYPLLEQDKELRYSMGVGATWYTPIGPLSLSYAKPINSKPTDQTEKFQFQIGSVF